MNYTEIRYQQEEPNGFFATLNKKVNEHFQKNNLTRKANLYGKFKAFFFLSVYVGLVAAIYMANGSIAILLSAFAVLGFWQICCALVLGHEGVHESFSSNKNVNKVMSYAFDLIGSSGYLWGLRHIHSHHPYPMVPGQDVDIHQTGMLTFVPMENPKKIYKYQHIYSPFLYLFYTVQIVTKRDFKDFFSSQIGHKIVKHKRSKFVELFIAKTIYFAYVLVLPLMLSGVYWGWVLLGFLIMHMVESITAAVSLFPAHIHEHSVFPLPDENGMMQDTWAEHQLRVTTDFGTKWKIVGFFFGGINYHAVHHLYPAMSHVHFHAVQKMLSETCKEFNIQHNVEPYLYKAVISHLKLLRKHGISVENIHHLAEVV